jgi:hypothetical protein
MKAISLTKEELEALDKLILQIDTVNALGINQVFAGDGLRILKYNIRTHLNEKEEVQMNKQTLPPPPPPPDRVMKEGGPVLRRHKI